MINRMLKKIVSNQDYRNISLLKRPIVILPMAADIIHYGHIRLIQRAHKYGTIIIALMTNKGLKTYKKKPVFNYLQRKEIISSIKYVSYVIPLDGLKYLELAENLKSEFFVHGTDWKSGPQKNVRKKLIIKVNEWGGKVVEIPYTKNISSSAIRKELII